MSYYKQIIVLLLFVQMLTSCWARYRYIPETWSAPANYWSNIEEFDKNDNTNSNNINESDLLEKFLPVTFKAKKSLHRISHFANEERRKKFLSESTNFQGGHSLQGLWALPGRR